MKLNSSRKKANPLPIGGQNLRPEKEILKELGYDDKPTWHSEPMPVPMEKALEEEGPKKITLPENCTWCRFRQSDTTQNGRKYSETETCGLGMLDPIPPPGGPEDRYCSEFAPIDISPKWEFPKVFGGNIDEDEGPYYGR